MKYEGNSAIARWREQVISHHEQSIAVQDHFEPNKDFWEGMTGQFKPDSLNHDDVVLQRLIAEFQDCKSILDVGGGAGRYALPLALLKENVTVVDSSRGMLDELGKSMRSMNLQNVRSVFCTWPGPELPMHDGILCSHVMYGIEDILTFVNKLNSHAVKKVVALSFMESPQAHLAMIWGKVHGERRIMLPGVPELMSVLWEADLFPELSVLEILSPHVYRSPEHALTDLRSRLYLNRFTDKDRTLVSLLESQLEEVDGGVSLIRASKRRLCLIKWETS